MARAKRAEVPVPETSATSSALDELTGSLPRLVELPLAVLFPHPHNPRRDLGDLSELAESIRATGIRQPLTVVPILTTDDEPSGHYQTVIGHRRAAAAALAGRTTVPAIVDESLTAAQQLELMLVENVQRADLSPVEEADGYQGLLDLGLDVEAIVASTGRSESTVRRRLRLLALPDKARQKIHTGQATLEQAARIAEFDDDPELVEALAKTLGSKDFDNELAKAVERHKVELTLRSLVERLEGAGATKADNPPNGGYAGSSPAGMTQVDYLIRGELRGGLTNRGVVTFLEKAADAGPGWVFRVSHSSYDDNLYLFRPLTEEAQAGGAAAQRPVDPEWERAQAERRAEIAARTERHERFTTLRGRFLAELRGRKLTRPQTDALAVFVARRQLDWFWTGDGPYPTDDKVLAALDVDPDAIAEQASAEEADADDAIFEAVQTAIAGLDTGHALLLVAVLGDEAAVDSTSYGHEDVKRYYTLLEQLGYEISDEERAVVWPPTESDVDAQPGDDVDEDGWVDPDDVADLDD